MIAFDKNIIRDTSNFTIMSAAKGKFRNSRFSLGWSYVSSSINHGQFPNISVIVPVSAPILMG